MKYYKTFIIFLSLAFALYFLLSDSFRNSIVFLNVGQGDSILINVGSNQLLIDVGYDRKVVDSISKYMPIFDRTIEYLVITHNHFDHYGGINDLLRYYKVSNVIFVKQDCLEGVYFRNLWNDVNYTCISNVIDGLQMGTQDFDIIASFYYSRELKDYLKENNLDISYVSQEIEDDNLDNINAFLNLGENNDRENKTKDYKDKITSSKSNASSSNKVCKNENNCSIVTYLKVTNNKDESSLNQNISWFENKKNKNINNNVNSIDLILNAIIAFVNETKTFFTDILRSRSGDYILWGSIDKMLSENENAKENPSALDFSQLDILLMGDAESELEKEYLDYLKESQIDIGGENSRIEVLKAGHHCSRTASSSNFIDYLKPNSAICSLGKDNKFGHPHIETINLFEKNNIDIYDTSRDGDIVILL